MASSLTVNLLSERMDRVFAGNLIVPCPLSLPLLLLHIYDFRVIGNRCVSVANKTSSICQHS